MMKWKTVSFAMINGYRGHIEHEGVHTDGVDLPRARRQELYIEGLAAVCVTGQRS